MVIRMIVEAHSSSSGKVRAAPSCPLPPRQTAYTLPSLLLYHCIIRNGEQLASVLVCRSSAEVVNGYGNMMRIRVVLADDHVVVRKGIRDFLEDSGRIDVVAETGNGEKVKELIQTHLPDVAVLDIQMPDATGIEVARWVNERQLPVQVLLLTAYDDDPFVLAAVQAGARGYILKNAEADQIVSAVETVARGQSTFGSGIAEKLVAHMLRQGGSESEVDTLSEREREVLRLAAVGLTNRAIGLKLAISDRTVQGHLAGIYGKLRAGSRTEAVTKALQLGIIELPKSSDG